MLVNDKSADERFSAAALAATRINALLIAKGKSNHIINNRFCISEESLVQENGLYVCNFDIGGMDPMLKKIITYKEITKEIEEKHDVKVAFLTQEQQLTVNDENVMQCNHIQISSPDKDKIFGAMKKVQSILSYISDQINHGNLSKNKSLQGKLNNSFQPNIPFKPQGIQYPMGHYIQEKVFVGLEQTNDRTFLVNDHLKGPNSCYLDHIRKQTGVTISIRGKGSGFLEPASGKEAWEPLHIHLMHSTKDGIEAAKKLASNLIETVQTKLTIHQQSIPCSYINPFDTNANYAQPYFMPLNNGLPIRQSPFPLASALDNMFQYPANVLVNNFTLRSGDVRIAFPFNRAPPPTAYNSTTYPAVGSRNYSGPGHNAHTSSTLYPLPHRQNYSTTYPLPPLNSAHPHHVYNEEGDRRHTFEEPPSEFGDRFRGRKTLSLKKFSSPPTSPYGTKEYHDKKGQESSGDGGKGGSYDESFSVLPTPSGTGNAPEPLAQERARDTNDSHKRGDTKEDFMFKIPDIIRPMNQKFKRKRGANPAGEYKKVREGPNLEQPHKEPSKPSIPSLVGYGSESSGSDDGNE